MNLRTCVKLGAAGLLATGCCETSEWNRGDGRAPIARPESAPEPPHIESVEVPDWPPVGPNGTIRVTATDNVNLARLDVSFRNTMSASLHGTRDTAVFTGDELGEGFGTLGLRAYDASGASAARFVSSLLVDLTPPEIVLMNTAVRRAEDGPNTDVELWVADGWVLGSVELEADGLVLVHAFPEVYPATIATTWDASLVRFPSMDLPAGRHTAHLTALDAAGNLAEEDFELLVDGSLPQAEILWPLTASHVSGVFSVRVAGSDEEGEVEIELWAGGGPLTTVLGPTATIEVDASDFVGGPLHLTAIAVDEAGNRSEEASCTVIVE